MRRSFLWFHKCDWCFEKACDTRFCCDAHKMAWHRAYKKYLESRVTKSRDLKSARSKDSNAKKKFRSPANGSKAKNSLVRESDGSYSYD